MKIKNFEKKDKKLNQEGNYACPKYRQLKVDYCADD